MNEGVQVIVGRAAEDVAASFLDAVERAERGEAVHGRVLSFESCEGLAAVMTEERCGKLDPG